MKDLKVLYTEKPELQDTVFIEGLPGIGYVGKIAVEYIIKELKAEKFAKLCSTDFPPQVLIDKNGFIEDMKIEFYFLKGEGNRQKDLIFITGNTQSVTPEGQYRLSHEILDFAGNFGVSEIYTLGGLGMKGTVNNPRVYGAVTEEGYISTLEELGVVIKRETEGEIVGISGLLLSLGRQREIPGLCLMGETSGFYIDPEASEAVLNVLSKLLNLDIDMANLKEEGKAARQKFEESKTMEQKMMENMGLIKREGGDEDIRYIG